MFDFSDEPLASALCERHRPRKFDDVVGHNDVKAVLRSQAKAAKIEAFGGRSMLLHGPHGCGKTSLAEIYGRALHCDAVDGEPCLACDNCALWEIGGHPNLARINSNELDAQAIIREISAQVSSEFLGGGWHVLLIDDADRLPAAVFAAIHDKLERPLPRTTLILCASEIDRIPERTRSLFLEGEVGLLSVPDRERLLKRIAAAENIAIDAGAIEMLARWGGGSARTLIKHLETLQLSDGLRLIDIWDYFNPGTRHVSDYLSALLDRRSLEQQLAALDSWHVEANRKSVGIAALLGELFRAEVRAYAREFDPLAKEREGLRHEFRKRADELGLPPGKLFSSALSFWRREPAQDEFGLLAKISDFDELLNGPGGQKKDKTDEAPRSRRRLFVSKAPGATPRSAQQGSAISGRKAPSGADYLSFGQAQDIWDAGSFLVQKFGLFLNARMSFRHDLLGIKTAAEVGPFITEFLHELRMVIERRSASLELPEPFHSIHVHETLPNGEKVTHIAASIPAMAGDVEEWIVRQFLPNAFGANFKRHAFRMRRWRLTGEKELHRHITLLRLLLRGLDPAYIGDKPAGNGATLRQEALLKILGIRCARPAGRRFGAQRYSPSRAIGRGARAESAETLPPLSVFGERLWAHIASGWELTEFRYRRALESKKAEGLAGLDRDWPLVQGDELLASRRRAEGVSLAKAWAAGLDLRKAERPGYGSRHS